MLIVQDQVWNRVTENRFQYKAIAAQEAEDGIALVAADRTEPKATRYYIDEFHLLLKEEQTAAYSVEIWKRFRKWGGKVHRITLQLFLWTNAVLLEAEVNRQDYQWRRNRERFCNPNPSGRLLAIQQSHATHRA